MPNFWFCSSILSVFLGGSFAAREVFLDTAGCAVFIEYLFQWKNWVCSTQPEDICHTVVSGFHAGFASLLNKLLTYLHTSWSGGYLSWYEYIYSYFLLIKYSCVSPLMASCYWISEMDCIQKYCFQNLKIHFNCSATDKGVWKGDKEQVVFFFLRGFDTTITLASVV